MNMNKIITAMGSIALFIIFMVFGYSLSIKGLKPITMPMNIDFGHALWNLRRVDVFIQIMIIFTCALGILTFFAERDKE